MNSFDLRLLNFQIVEIQGFSSNVDDDKGPEFQAIFNAQYLSDPEELSVGDSFECALNFKAKQEIDRDPFFTIRVKGRLSINNDTALRLVKQPGSEYEVSALLFPYLRSVSAPILESISQADIEFPLYLPEKPAVKSPRARSPRKTSRKK